MKLKLNLTVRWEARAGDSAVARVANAKGHPHRKVRAPSWVGPEKAVLPAGSRVPEAQKSFLYVFQPEPTVTRALKPPLPLAL
jgi:hypothetical protein